MGHPAFLAQRGGVPRRLRGLVPASLLVTNQHLVYIVSAKQLVRRPYQ